MHQWWTEDVWVPHILYTSVPHGFHSGPSHTWAHVHPTPSLSQPASQWHGSDMTFFTCCYVQIYANHYKTKQKIVPCMVYLPSHGHIVTQGRLWNMQGPVHTSLWRPGTGLLSNIVEREYTSSSDKQNIQLPYATLTEPHNTRRTQSVWMSMLVWH